MIKDDELVYTTKLDEKEKEYAQNLNVKEKVLKLLPDEYQQVEYIESTGTQWIDTKYIFYGENAKIEFKVQYTNFLSTYNYLFGSQVGTGTTATRSLNVCFKNNQEFSFTSNGVPIDISNNQVYIQPKNNINVLGSYFQDNKEGYSISILNGVKKEQRYTGSMITGLPETLFCKNTSGNKGAFSKLILHFFKIYDNDILIRNFIPSYSTTNVIGADGVQVPANTKGLYDLVEGKFYTNQGTGEDFIAGPDVNE